MRPTIRKWLDDQTDRESNGDNWRRLAGRDRLEFGIGLLLHEWRLGVEASRVDDYFFVSLLLGPVTVGLVGWTG